MATANRISDSTPTTIPGVMCAIGKRKPVTLVATVVVRNKSVQRSRRFEVRSPYITTSPDPIPTRLIRTCSSVNVAVVIPRIMTHLRADEALYACESHVSQNQRDPSTRLRAGYGATPSKKHPMNVSVQLLVASGRFPRYK